MKKTLKRKICWNCETIVDFAQENCTSCRVYLSPYASFENENSSTRLMPPYHFENQLSENDETLDDSHEESEKSEIQKSHTVNSNEVQFERGEVKKVILTLFLLLLGSIFLVFTLFMLIFSTEGILRFSLNASYWPVYLTLSTPLLFFGWKGLNSIY